jgi:hypothetical protein
VLALSLSSCGFLAGVDPVTDAGSLAAHGTWVLANVETKDTAPSIDTGSCHASQSSGASTFSGSFGCKLTPQNPAFEIQISASWPDPPAQITASTDFDVRWVDVPMFWNTTVSGTVPSWVTYGAAIAHTSDSGGANNVDLQISSNDSNKTYAHQLALEQPGVYGQADVHIAYSISCGSRAGGGTVFGGTQRIYHYRFQP